MNDPRPAPASPADAGRLDRQVEAELVRIAFQDALFGAPFGIVIALLFSFAIRSAFPARTVLFWLLAAFACNLLRLVSRWAFFRQPARLLINAETRSEVLSVMCVLYVAYMSLAARQQLATLRRTVRLGFENAALQKWLPRFPG